MAKKMTGDSKDKRDSRSGWTRAEESSRERETRDATRIKIQNDLCDVEEGGALISIITSAP